MRYLLSIIVLLVFMSGCKTITVVDESWRNTRPSASQAAPAKLPVFQKTILPNGLTLLVSEDHRLPIVDVKLVIRAGSSRDAPYKWGQSSMCFDMLDEGAGDYDALELTKAFADIGTQLNIAVTQDAGVLNMAVLSENLERGLELMSIEVLQPHFYQKDFDRVKTLYLSTLQAKLSSAGAVAVDAFYERAYGKLHPYGHDTQGTLSSIPKLFRRDVEQFWKNYFSPNQTAVVVAGDVTLEQAQELVSKYFGNWKHAAVATEMIPNPQTDGKGSVQHLPRKGAPQTVFAFGRPLISAQNPNRATLDLMNEIIGGMFTSRLNMNLREAKSWSYGVRSQLDARQHDGPWIAMTNIQAPFASQALREIQYELKHMQEELVTEAELKMAKDGLLKSLPAKFETVEVSTAAAVNLFVYDLPLNYFEQWQQKIALVTREDILAAAKNSLDYDKMTVVTVGDF